MDKFEVVNIKDGSRMSRSHGKGSSTVFDSVDTARIWMSSVGLDSFRYEVRPAKEDLNAD